MCSLTEDVRKLTKVVAGIQQQQGSIGLAVEQFSSLRTAADIDAVAMKLNEPKFTKAIVSYSVVFHSLSFYSFLLADTLAFHMRRCGCKVKNEANRS